MSDVYNPYRPPDAPVSGGGSPRPGGGSLPWENRSQLGFWPALRDTFLLLLKTPADAFRMAARTGDYNSPLLWAVLLGTVFGVIGQIWGVMFNFATIPLMGSDAGPGAVGFGVLGGVGVLIVSIFIIPIGVIIGLFISSGLFHLCLMLIGGLQNSRTGFEGTVRAVAYSYVANSSQVVPVVGSFIYLVWAVVLWVIGLREVHNTTTGKALLAVFIPVIVCCGFFILVFGAAMMAAIGGAAANDI